MTSVDELLSLIPHPEVASSLKEMGMIREVKLNGNDAEITVVVPSGYRLSSVIEMDIEAVLKENGYNAHVHFVESGGATDYTHAAGEEYHRGSPFIGPLPRKEVHNIIAVASGKGGVGKSFVTASLAVHLSLLGYSSGILDADITGPCISRMFGVSQLPEMQEDGKIKPLRSVTGISIMSIDVIMDRFRTPLIWRGPLINSAIRGLFSETDWGKLDFLLVDLPPGTSDAPLTVFQSLRPDGAIFVTSPMQIAISVVRRAVNMAVEMKVPVLGLIENMSFLKLPDGSRINVFGKEAGQVLGKELDIPFLGTIPLDPAIGPLSDRGEIELYRNEELFRILRKMRFAISRRETGKGYGDAS